MKSLRGIYDATTKQHTQYKYSPDVNFKIYQEKAGAISKKACWVCLSEGFLYTAPTLKGLIQILNTEWKRRRHFVGEISDTGTALFRSFPDGQ